MGAPVDSDLPGPATSTRIARDVGASRAGADVAIQVAVRAANIALGIIATAVLARSLGEARYGVWSTILLVPALLAYLGDLGLQQVAVRHASAEDDPTWLGAMFTARLALSIPATLINVAVVLLLSDDEIFRIAGTILALQALLSAPAGLAGVFQVRVRNDLTVAVMTINSLLWTAAVVVLAHNHAGLVAYAIAFIAIAAVTSAVQMVLALRGVRIPLRGTQRLWRELARTAVPLSIAGLLTLAYARIDGLIVYTSAGSAAAGLYGAAYRIVEQAAFVPMSLILTFGPIVARAVPGRLDQARSILQNAVDLLAMFSFPALAFALVASQQAIELLYGASFADAAPALTVLTGAFVLICGGYAFGMFILVLDLQRRFVLFGAIALCVNVALNLVLVPKYGFLAAAWITLATEALVLSLIGPAVLRRLQMRLRLGRMARTALASAVVGFGLLGLRELGLGVLWLMLVAVAANGAALFAVGALRPAEIRALLTHRAPNVAG